MKKEIVADELIDDILTHAIPIDRLKAMISSMQTWRVLAFGESHWFNNPFRHMVAEWMNELAQKGVSNLAMEFEQHFQPEFDRFSVGKISAEQLVGVLKGSNGSLTCDDKPCAGYLKIFNAAKRARIQLLAIDKERNESSEHPDYAKDPRELHMAQAILDQLNKHPESKTIVYCGANHIYRRQKRQEYPSMAEAVTYELGAAKSELLSIGAVLPTKTNPAELTFRKLYALSDELTEAKAVWTKDSASLSHIILGHDRRCPWGGCFQSDSNECPGISHEICQNIPMTEIDTSCWDILVLFPKNWPIAAICS